MVVEKRIGENLEFSYRPWVKWAFGLLSSFSLVPVFYFYYRIPFISYIFFLIFCYSTFKLITSFITITIKPEGMSFSYLGEVGGMDWSEMEEFVLAPLGIFFFIIDETGLIQMKLKNTKGFEKVIKILYYHRPDLFVMYSEKTQISKSYSYFCFFIISIGFFYLFPYGRYFYVNIISIVGIFLGIWFFNFPNEAYVNAVGFFFKSIFITEQIKWENIRYIGFDNQMQLFLEIQYDEAGKRKTKIISSRKGRFNLAFPRIRRYWGYIKNFHVEKETINFLPYGLFSIEDNFPGRIYWNGNKIGFYQLNNRISSKTPLNILELLFFAVEPDFVNNEPFLVSVLLENQSESITWEIQKFSPTAFPTKRYSKILELEEVKDLGLSEKIDTIVQTILDQDFRVYQYLNSQSD